MNEEQSPTELKQWVRQQINELKQYMENQFETQHKLSTEILQEITKIKHFLSRLPIDDMGFSLGARYQSKNFNLRESVEGGITNRPIDSISQEPDDLQATSQSVPQDQSITYASSDNLESLNNLKNYLIKVRQDLSSDIINMQNKLFKSIKHLDHQIKDEFTNKDWANYFYTATLFYNTIITYLSTYINNNAAIPKYIDDLLTVQWKDVKKSFPIPIETKILIFLDDFTQELKKGKKIGKKEKTASEIQKNVESVLIAFNSIFTESQG